MRLALIPYEKQENSKLKIVTKHSPSYVIDLHAPQS